MNTGDGKLETLRLTSRGQNIDETDHNISYGVCKSMHGLWLATKLLQISLYELEPTNHNAFRWTWERTNIYIYILCCSYVPSEDEPIIIYNKSGVYVDVSITTHNILSHSNIYWKAEQFKKCNLTLQILYGLT